MPIQIKEILPSDSISGLTEKINFNFDQLVLAGGGPPGIQGFTGPSGPPGPIGRRGSRWLVSGTGGTGLPDGGNLEADDQSLEADGDVFTFFDVLGSTGWTYSGVNLMGPTGPSGQTGGTFEWGYFPGSTGGVQDPGTFGPTTGNSTTVSSPHPYVDFIIPTRPEKNAVFIGDRHWAYQWLSDFNTQPTGTDQSNVPKLTIIQQEVNYEGLNGLAFGAMGLTSGATGGSIPAIGSTAAAVTAYDFVTMGFKREPVSVEYQRFRVNSYRTPFLLRVGGIDPGYDHSTLEVVSGWLLSGNYDGSRAFNHAESNTLIPPYVGANTTQSYYELLAKPDQFRFYHGSTATTGTAGYISLQPISGSFSLPSTAVVDHGFGSVIVGPTYSNVGTYVPFTMGHPSALVVSRPVTTIDANVDSSLKFYSPANLFGGPNDYVGKVVASYAGVSDDPTPVARLQISTRRLSLNDKFDGNADRYTPRFPVHVNQRLANLSSAAGGVWPGQYASPSIASWLIGFDSFDSSGDSSLYQGKGLGIAYARQDGLGSNAREIVLQTYYTGATGIYDTPPQSGTALGRGVHGNPHLFTQAGDELSTGNLGVGFELPVWGDGAGFPLDPFKMLPAKLSVAGSVRIGSRDFFSWQLLNTQERHGPKWGLAVQGSVLQGATYYEPSTSNLTNSQLITYIGATYGVFSASYVLGNRFIATQNGASNFDPAPSFALPDAKSGMRGSTYGGEVYVQVGFGNANNSAPITRHAANGQDNTDSAKFGFQVLQRAAFKPQYFRAQDMAGSTVPVTGPTGSGLWSLTTIPTQCSVVKFDGDGLASTSLGNISWKQVYAQAQGISALDNVFMVELEEGYYEGQIVELVFTGWGMGLLPSYLAPPDFMLRNDARYLYSYAQRMPRMLLQREFNNGGYGSGRAGFNGADDQGYPYPFPHGATNTSGLLSSASLDATKWSTDGQFTAIGYRTISFRWTRTITPVLNYPTHGKYRWVEVARTHLSTDLSITTGAWPGDPGSTT